MESLKPTRQEKIEALYEPVGEWWLCAGACGDWKRGMAAAHNGSGYVCLECERAALATDAQIADLQGRLAEAERELQESCGGPLPADFDVVDFLVSRGWKYNGP